MTRDENQLNVSPVKRSRLVVRQPLESRRLPPNDNSSPTSGSMSKPPFSLRGSVIVHSPKSPRASILPPRGSPRTTPGSISRSTRVFRYEEPEETTPKPESLSKSVRFAQPDIQKRDPAIIFCSSSSEEEQDTQTPKDEGARPPLSPQAPKPQDLAATLQRFLAMGKEDRQKLQNLLNALNLLENDYPQPAAPPFFQLPPFVPVTNVTSPTEDKAIPIDVKSPVQVKSIRIEGKGLNPKAPAFRDFSTLKTKISPKEEEKEVTKVPSDEVKVFEFKPAEFRPIEIKSPDTQSAVVSPIEAPKVSIPNAEIQPTPASELNWKMTPKRTWPASVLRQHPDPLRTRPKLELKVPTDKPTILKSPVAECPPPPPASPDYAAVNVTDWLHTQPPEPKPQKQQPDMTWLGNSPWALPVPPYHPIGQIGQMPTMPPIPPMHLMQNPMPWMGHMPFYPIGLPFPPPPPPPPPPMYQPPSQYEDVPHSPGRVGAALPLGWGDKVLDNFAAKYPLTGFPPSILSNSRTSSIAGGKNHLRKGRRGEQSSADAAIVQQQLEELILEKKEKDALAKMNKEETERRAKWQRGATLIDL